MPDYFPYCMYSDPNPMPTCRNDIAQNQVIGIVTTSKYQTLSDCEKDLSNYVCGAKPTLGPNNTGAGWFYPSIFLDGSIGYMKDMAALKVQQAKTT